MKKLAAILCSSALATGAFAQGLVTFANGPTTQISSGAPGSTAALAANNQGGYIFALLTSATAGGPFAFTQIYGTNTASAGRIGPGTYSPAVNGWAPGATMFYEVAGWSAALGTTWNSAWLVNNAPAGANSAVWGGKSGFFGLSGIASGAAGGGSPVPAPALPLFGGTGLSGFDLTPVGGGIVPEPSTMALAGLGAAALMIFRRRK